MTLKKQNMQGGAFHEKHFHFQAQNQRLWNNFEKKWFFRALKYSNVTDNFSLNQFRIAIFEFKCSEMHG